MFRETMGSQTPDLASTQYTVGPACSLSPWSEGIRGWTTPYPAGPGVQGDVGPGSTPGRAYGSAVIPTALV
jgi:hypothetical protein